MKTISTPTSLTITNERICNFYQKNPSINFEAVNLIFIDLFDKLLHDMHSTMNVTVDKTRPQD